MLIVLCTLFIHIQYSTYSAEDFFYGYTYIWKKSQNKTHNKKKEKHIIKLNNFNHVQQHKINNLSWHATDSEIVYRNE